MLSIRKRSLYFAIGIGVIFETLDPHVPRAPHKTDFNHVSKREKSQRKSNLFKERSWFQISNISYSEVLDPQEAVNLYGGACTWNGMPLPSNNYIELNSAGSWSVDCRVSIEYCYGVGGEGRNWNGMIENGIMGRYFGNLGGNVDKSHDSGVVQPPTASLLLLFLSLPLVSNRVNNLYLFLVDVKISDKIYYITMKGSRPLILNSQPNFLQKS
ncbi:hypothetical protein CFP56_001266 [Quercus suber]|uniref:Uncharacterized protein n=1 Tax=Quercus suber TaxID=58331 RepID=A0AAW0IMG3_QUESU